MNLTKTKLNGINLLIAEGAVEESGLREIAEGIGSLPSSAEKYVLLDCTGVKQLFYSSIGFSGFVNHLLHLKKLQAGIILFGCDNQVQKLLELLRLNRCFEYAPTLDEAFLNLNKVLQKVQTTS